jgi:circadian clock protein KaiC
MNLEATERPEDRVPTGVPGLDTVLHGGLLKRGVYMLHGRPGAGKTILANQIAFHHAAMGGHVLYTTLLAESHERLLFNLKPMSFFDLSRVPEQIAYFSAFSILEEEGLKGLVDALRKEARSRRTTLLVLDGLVNIEESAQSKRDFKKFIHELQIHANLVGCTVIMLTSSPLDFVGPEHTMVDGVMALKDERSGRKAERELEVKKFRGSAFLRGGHSFQITSDGILLFPRLEILLQKPSKDDPCYPQKVSMGVRDIDKALGGGIPCSSSTVLFGPTGAGKTTLGLHFLSQATLKEPALMYGFYETPERIFIKAKALGLDLEKLRDQGMLEIIWRPPTERILDALGNELIDTVRKRGVKRLFVDGVDGFVRAAIYPERVPHFLSAMTNEFRVQGVTTLYTSELHTLYTPHVELPIRGVSALVENILLLRFVEFQSQVHRMLSIVKVRDSAYDQTLRAMVITSRGIELKNIFEGTESLMKGEAKAASTSKPRKKSRGKLFSRKGKRFL